MKYSRRDCRAGVSPRDTAQRTGLLPLVSQVLRVGRSLGLVPDSVHVHVMGGLNGGERGVLNRQRPAGLDGKHDNVCRWTKSKETWAIRY